MLTLLCLWSCWGHVRSVAEGRAPWGGQPVLPAAELSDHDAGIWALSADERGRLIVSGTEEGVVTAWDMRSRQAAWQVCVSASHLRHHGAHHLSVCQRY